MVKLAENLHTTWSVMSPEEAAFFTRHHREILNVARYAESAGKRDVTIVSDDSPDEEGPVRGFRAVQFKRYRDDDTVVTVRTVFDVQYFHGESQPYRP